MYTQENLVYTQENLVYTQENLLLICGAAPAVTWLRPEAADLQVAVLEDARLIHGGWESPQPDAPSVVADAADEGRFLHGSLAPVHVRAGGGAVHVSAQL